MEQELLTGVTVGGVAVADYLIGKSKLKSNSTIDLVIQVVTLLVKLFINKKK